MEKKLSKTSLFKVLLSVIFLIFYIASCSQSTNTQMSNTPAPSRSTHQTSDSSTFTRVLPSTENPMIYPISSHYGMKIEENPLPGYTEKMITDIQKDIDWSNLVHSSHHLNRDERFMPFRMMTLMDLKPGDTIADIGTGTGYFAFRFSKVVGKKGKVYAVDKDPRVLKLINMIIERENINYDNIIDNIETIQNGNESVKIPENCLDYAFLGWTGIYGYIDYYVSEGAEKSAEPDEAKELIFQRSKHFTESIYNSLKKEGRLVIIDERKGMNPEMDNWDEGTIEILDRNGFELERRYDYMKTLYFLIFKKK